jgi:hypothetical protein
VFKKWLHSAVIKLTFSTDPSTVFFRVVVVCHGFPSRSDSKPALRSKIFANNKNFFNNVFCRSPSCGLKTDRKSNRNRKRQNFQTATETWGMVETDIFDYREIWGDTKKILRQFFSNWYLANVKYCGRDPDSLRDRWMRTRTQIDQHQNRSHDKKIRFFLTNTKTVSRLSRKKEGEVRWVSANSP